MILYIYNKGYTLVLQAGSQISFIANAVGFGRQ